MELEIKMNSELYANLLKEAIDSGIKRADEHNMALEKKIQRLKFFTSKEAMEILGYTNRDSLKRKLKESHISYRTLGKEFYISIDDMNKFIEKASRIQLNSL